MRPPAGPEMTTEGGVGVQARHSRGGGFGGHPRGEGRGRSRGASASDASAVLDPGWNSPPRRASHRAQHIRSVLGIGHEQRASGGLAVEEPHERSARRDRRERDHGRFRSAYVARARARASLQAGGGEQRHALGARGAAEYPGRALGRLPGGSREPGASRRGSLRHRLRGGCVVPVPSSCARRSSIWPSLRSRFSAMRIDAASISRPSSETAPCLVPRPPSSPRRCGAP